MPQFSEKISLQLEFMRAKFSRIELQGWIRGWFCNWVWSSGFLCLQSNVVLGWNLFRTTSCSPAPSKIRTKHSRPDQTFNIYLFFFFFWVCFFIFIFISQPDEIAFSLSCNCRSSWPLFLFVRALQLQKWVSFIANTYDYMPILYTTRSILV